MSKILLVFAGQHRNGNTTALVDAFCKGVSESGSEVEVLNIGTLALKGCVECFGCYPEHKGCVQKDELREVYASLDDYSAIVFAGPVFFGNLPAQIKIFIDRLFSRYPGLGPKKSALLMTAEGTEEIGRGGMSNLDAARLSYTTALHYIYWDIQGIIISKLAQSYEQVAKSAEYDEAYNLGRKMGADS